MHHVHVWMSRFFLEKQFKQKNYFKKTFKTVGISTFATWTPFGSVLPIKLSTFISSCTTTIVSFHSNANVSPFSLGFFALQCIPFPVPNARMRKQKSTGKNIFFPHCRLSPSIPIFKIDWEDRHNKREQRINSTIIIVIIKQRNGTLAR